MDRLRPNRSLCSQYTEQIRHKEDFNILSKKLAQKIYSKERLRGTVHMNEKSSQRIRSYIKDYFSKHKTYQHHDHSHRLREGGEEKEGADEGRRGKEEKEER
jgi:hypothetical protein